MLWTFPDTTAFTIAFERNPGALTNKFRSPGPKTFRSDTARLAHLQRPVDKSTTSKSVSVAASESPAESQTRHSLVLTH